MMGKVTFSNKWGRVKVQKTNPAAGDQKTIEEKVREMKNSAKASGNEDYREQSLKIHGLVCARCGREFDEAKRNLLTVHHKDGNHFNNPVDGSNWENLCAYCHEDVHSRGELAAYLGNENSQREFSVAYEDKPAETGKSLLAEKLQRALQKR
jgi:predicted HNH restriction endonuclease